MKKFFIFLGAHCISPKFTILRLNSWRPCKGEKWREIALFRHFDTRCLKTLHKNIFVKKWACAIVFLIFLFLIVLPVLADDDSGDMGGIGDSMQYTNSVENAFTGQKQITDEEFQKTVDKIKAKQNKGKTKTFKGKSFNEDNSGGHIDETAAKTSILTVPLSLINGDGAEIPIGLYKIVGKKVDGNIYLEFYQSSTLVAKVPAIETKNDFNESNINFVKLLPYNTQRVEVIYGSMDFNAYTFIRIEKEISDSN